MSGSRPARFLVLLVSILSLTCTCGSFERTSYIASPWVTNWGRWGRWSRCFKNSLVTAIDIKVENDQGSGDDTALNAIKLGCADSTQRIRHWITSKESKWGEWRGVQTCDNGTYAFGFELKAEGNQYAGDDTAANDIKLFCRAPGETDASKTLHLHGAKWGSWTGKELCPYNQGICGIRTQVEAPGGDDTALNNVIMRCCDEPENFGQKKIQS